MKFVLPPLLMRSRPRETELTAAGRALAAFALLLLAGSVVAGIAMYRVSAREAAERRALFDRGVTVTGEVSRLWSEGDDRRRVAYRFLVNGLPYSGRVTVSAERRRLLEIGSPLAVRYVPGRPAINDLGGRSRGGMPVAVPFIVSPLIAALGIVFLLLIGRQRHMLADGRVAPAVVTGHHSHQNTHGGKQRSISYEFRLLSGARATGKSGSSDKPPAVGSTICVLYDPDLPARVSVYPLSLVRPAP